MPKRRESPLPRYQERRDRGTAVSWVYDESGKRHQVTLGAYGSPESKRRYRELLASLVDGRVSSSAAGPCPAHASGVTIETLAARFLAWAERYYRKPDGTPTREFPNFVAAARPLLELYRDELATEFGPLKLRRVREVMVGLGWSRTFINKQVVRLRRMFKWGVEQELIAPSVHQALQAVAGLKRGRTSAPEPKGFCQELWMAS